MKKIIPLAIFIIILGGVLQTNKAQEMPNVIPPSPNAQTFLKYGEFPVSNYTGVPDITIPIYTIKLKDISIPINISYNASGIRVDEEATRVGLGWVLNAGGVITHTIMGRYNDFDCDAYFNENSISDISSTPSQQLTFNKFTIGAYNSEFPISISESEKNSFYKSLIGDSPNCEVVTDLAPDVFNYNFMGYSGKFIFSHSGEIIKEKEDNLKIELTGIYPENVAFNDSRKKTLKSWRITTPDGMKYDFGQIEECWLPPFTSWSSHNSSFYLTKIETVNGSIINFSYKKNLSTGIYGRLGGIAHETGGSPINRIINFAQYDIIYLDEITYPNGLVKFNYLFDREDLQPEPRLDNVTISNIGSSTVKWAFIQDYFTANKVTYETATLNEISKALFYNCSYYNENWKNKRLKLKSLRCENSLENYQFEYNETELPSKLSASQDHWGYYNGSNNYYMIPSFIQNISQNGNLDVKYYAGYNANREPVEEYNKSFLLYKITYPTGGKTEFTYESNKYKTDDFENDPLKRDFMYSLNEVSIQTVPQLQNAGDDWNITKPFFIAHNNESNSNSHQVSIYFKIWINKDRYNSMQNYTNRVLNLSVLNYNNTAIWSYNYDVYQIPQTLTSNYFAEKSWETTLGAGNYTLKAQGNMITCIDSMKLISNFFTYPSAYLSAHPIGIGGGLRVKEIKSYDKDGCFSFGKQYRYTNDGSASESQTSGRLMFYPRYRKSFNIISSEGLRGGGYSVGYSKVHIFDIDKFNNTLGKTEYEYINKPDINLRYSENGIKYEATFAGTFFLNEIKIKDKNPQGIGAYKFSENGTLLKEIFYNNNGMSLLKQKEITYHYLISDNPNTIWGVIKSEFIPYKHSLCVNDAILLETYQSTWPIETGWIMTFLKGGDIALGHVYPALRPLYILLKTKTETDYENGQAIETITNYSYNSKKQLMKEELKSQNKILKTIEYDYPIDKISESNMQLLIDANRINTPVETRQIINNRTKLVKNNYSLFNGIPKISNILTNTASNYTQEARIIYHKYDSYGNPVNITKDDANNVIYLWSYNGQYPIAEIKNATYSDVENSVKSIFSVISIDALSALSIPDESKIKDGTLQRALPNAQVTTFTYKPLVGITSTTDPRGVTTYYEYDTFGRLIQTYMYSNGEKQILQHYDYHYKN